MTTKAELSNLADYLYECDKLDVSLADPSLTGPQLVDNWLDYTERSSRSHAQYARRLRIASRTPAQDLQNGIVKLLHNDIDPKTKGAWVRNIFAKVVRDQFRPYGEHVKIELSVYRGNPDQRTRDRRIGYQFAKGNRSGVWFSIQVSISAIENKQPEKAEPVQTEPNPMTPAECIINKAADSELSGPDALELAKQAFLRLDDSGKAEFASWLLGQNAQVAETKKVAAV